jgi:hypothetical protein
MTLPELQACLDRIGVKVSARGDRLIVNAPPGVMSPELRAALASHKPALMARLSGVESDIGEPPPAVLNDPVAPSWPPRPAELAGWPVAWRQRWGRLANELQDRGIPWPDHERIAFDRIKDEMDAAP